VALNPPASACFIAIVSPAPNGVLSSGYALGPTPASSPSSWPTVLRNLGDLAWPLALATPPMWLSETLQSGLALAVCNGSYQPCLSNTMAASAWLISDSQNLVHCCHGVCAVAGPPNSINSYCAELQGMHGLLLYLNSVCQLFGISSGQALVACDNSMVITLCKYQGSSPPPNTSHLDLVWEIGSLHNASPLSLMFCHVQGHQDDLVVVTCLEPLAQLNVDADMLAKAHLQHLLHQGHMTTPLPLARETWSCWLGPTKVIHDPQRSLPYHLGIQSAKAYLIQKQQFFPASFDLVDRGA